MLFEQGVRIALLFGIGEVPAQGYEAAVVCLKTRSAPVEESRRLSRKALERLRSAGARQIQFKYCSTFDSTPKGNIGPVTDELMTALDTSFTIAVPALPVNGRTQYLGHLFVNGLLLSDSPLRTHPLNPMTDSNLVRWLQLQTHRRVGLIGLDAVRSGRLEAPEGVAIALVDAIADQDLEAIARAFVDLPLITGGSGLAIKLPTVWRERGWLEATSAAGLRVSSRPGALILSGSCSAATLGQLDAWKQAGGKVISMNVQALGSGEIDALERAALAAIDSEGVALIASSAAPAYRVPEASAAIERAFGDLARRLTPRAGKVIVAGGETAGAVVEALDIKAVELTAILDPGVPALRSLDERRLGMALKSGNFGSRDFFRKAVERC
ncbi:MAG: four-carbon acid sugar kinase family protein [Bryobacterales bacterium]|nr:four-carbon acid sugar kinase family protein [Bryobacterales bacterium]